MSSREIRRGREGKERRRTIGLGGAAGAGEEAMVARTSGSMQRRRWTSRRLQPLLSIGLGKEVVAVTVAVNLMFCAPGPHLLFIGLRDRGPPTRSRLSIPDQDAVKGSELAVGPIRLRSILTRCAFRNAPPRAPEQGGRRRAWLRARGSGMVSV
jgi:hypothetical protein